MLQNFTFSCNIFLAHFVRKEFEQKAAILCVDETLEIFSRSNIRESWCKLVLTRVMCVNSSYGVNSCHGVNFRYGVNLSYGVLRHIYVGHTA